MSLHIVSLIANADQVIPNDGAYHLLRFPYEGESYDPWGMHDPTQPDGHPAVTDWAADDRAGLIWPSVTGWGWLTAMAYWEPSDYSEIRDRFVRDPLGLTTGYDSTATEDWAITPGGQYRHKHHEMFVHPGTPVGYLVRHSGSAGDPRKVFHAQFKLAIETDVVAPGGASGGE